MKNEETAYIFYLLYYDESAYVQTPPHTHTYDDDEWYQLNRMIVQSQSPPRVAFIV